MPTPYSIVAGLDYDDAYAGTAVRVAPQTTRSHRNLGDETVEIWAISRVNDLHDATKVDEFWEASEAAQTR